MKIISIIWLVTGIVLMACAVTELLQIANNTSLGINSGAFKATLFVIAFSLTCIIGSLGLMRQKAWGRLIILISAILSVIYTAFYFLLGGVEDTGSIYMLNVAALFILGIASIISIVKDWTLKEMNT